MTFYIGQKVVCVSAFRDKPEGETTATQGVVYTVRDVRTFEAFGTGLWLEEIRNPPVLCFFGLMERGMSAKRFRPLVERKTDISAFIKILDAVRLKEPV